MPPEQASIVAPLRRRSPIERLLPNDLAAGLQFLWMGLKQYEKNASFVPSSRALSDAMVEMAGVGDRRCVVEFGPGTGVITRSILKVLPPDGHLHAIELDGDLLRTTTTLINDPRLRPILGSATDARAHLREAGCNGGAEAVFSSLGIAIMSDETRLSILRAAREILRPETGVFVQFHYLHTRFITYQFGGGWSRFDGRRFHERHFNDVRSRRVFANFPPAAVYACRAPHVTVRPDLRARRQPRRPAV